MTRRLLSTPRVIAAVLAAAVAPARASSDEPPSFYDSIAESPGGRPSRVSEAPSTTFVITAEEIRHSGATSIPEILRRVPGLDVRLITASDGELGLRGFAYEITDRVLVMVDGRTVYIDFFGGTAYEMLPISLVDIERIEVVLGPGASVYGNKAMLGTINIITRSAADYAFAEARLDAGPHGDGRVGVRYGAIEGPWSLRATAVGRRLTPYDPRSPAGAGGGTLSATYSPAIGTEASLEIGGMQGVMDIIPTAAKIDRFEGTVGYARAQGRLRLGGPSAPYGDLHLDLVWNAGKISSETFPTESGFRATYDTPYARLEHRLRTRLFGAPAHGRWGAEVRLNTLDSTITTGERPVWNVAAYGNEEILLGRWRLTAGLRVDRSTLTRVSFSPRLSAVWSPVDGHQIRASFNTGYNDAHLLEYFADFPIGPLLVRPNLDLKAEHVVYGELGWAGILTTWLRASANAFAYRLDDWISLDPNSLTATSVAFGNNRPVDTYGGEVGLEVSLLRRALLAYASYALIGPQGSTDVGPYGVQPHFSPRDKVTGGVSVKLPAGAYLTADAQYFGRATVARPPNSQSQCVPVNPIFCRFDLDDFVMAHARVGWAFRSGLDLSLGVSNLLDDRTRQLPGAEAPERRAMATVAYYHP